MHRESDAESDTVQAYAEGQEKSVEELQQGCIDHGVYTDCDCDCESN